MGVVARGLGGCEDSNSEPPTDLSWICDLCRHHKPNTPGAKHAKTPAVARTSCLYRRSNHHKQSHSLTLRQSFKSCHLGAPCLPSSFGGFALRALWSHDSEMPTVQRVAPHNPLALKPAMTGYVLQRVKFT